MQPASSVRVTDGMCRCMITTASSRSTARDRCQMAETRTGRGVHSRRPGANYRGSSKCLYFSFRPSAKRLDPRQLMRPISNGLRLVLMIIGAGRILAPVPCTLAASPSENCEQLAQLEIPGASVLAAHLIGQGTFKPPNGTEVPIAKASCRVTATAHPSSDSVIKFEVWLPVDWNGRIWGVGNGNLAGQIVYRYLGGRLADGYAMVATDAGHETNSMDSTWAVGHPEKVVDFGYRAIHEAAVDAKRVVAAFYGSMPAYSYFEGCSDGGREALMEAQRYPSDYDGIIAGAPANDWTHLQIAQAQMQFLWLADTSHQIPVGKLPALESAVLQACDKLDG